MALIPEGDSVGGLSTFIEGLSGHVDWGVVLLQEWQGPGPVAMHRVDGHLLFAGYNATRKRIAVLIHRFFLTISNFYFIEME